METATNKLNIDELPFDVDETFANIDELSKKDAINVNSFLRLTIALIKNNVELEEESLHKISEHIYIKDRRDIIPELGTELLKQILLSDKPSVWIETLRKSGALKYFLPELLEGYECEQNEYHLYDVYWHLLHSCDNAENRLDIRMSALFHDIGKPRSKREALKRGEVRNTFYGHEIISSRMFKGIANRFCFSKEFVKKVIKLIRHHMFHYTGEWTDNAVRRFIRALGTDFIKDLFILRDADRKGSGKRDENCEAIENFKGHINDIIEKDKAPKVTDLTINGNDIKLRYQIEEGPIIGKVLKYLLKKIVEDPTLNHPETLYKLTDEYIEKLMCK